MTREEDNGVRDLERSGLYRQPFGRHWHSRWRVFRRAQSVLRIPKLGIDTATNGAYAANVIRAVPGRHAEGDWHVHDLDFQMIYILQGWVTFEYEGQGEVTFRSGSAALQPPGIRHREIRHSDDLELIEITSPAEFTTKVVTAPEGP